MEYVQIVLVEVKAASAEEASKPGGLFAEIEAHRASLPSRSGFASARVTRSLTAKGDTVLEVETRWRDHESLIDYESREPNVASVIGQHPDVVVPNSLRISTAEAPAGEPSPAGDATERILLPLLVPLGVFLFGVLVVYGLSRIYLEVPTEVATPLALAISVGILVVSWFLASNPSIRRWQVGAIALTVAALLAGGAIYAAVHDEEGETAGAPEVSAEATPGPSTGSTTTSPGGSPPPGALSIAAVPTLRFDHTEMTAEAGKEITVVFDNQDTGLPHNWALYENEAHSQPVAGANEGICTAPCTESVTFGPLDPGEYYFRCDVHPTQMLGTLTVSGAAAGGPTESPSPEASPAPSPEATPAGEATPSAAAETPGSLTIAMIPILEFDKAELRAEAGTDLTLAFDNQDTGMPHNWALYEDENHSQPLVGANQNICTAPCTDEVSFGPLDEGEYYYRCDVHPIQMVGVLRVE